MRLPGTRYQEHGWEHVRKLLGRCSLAVFARLPPGALSMPERRADMLDAYLDLMAEQLHHPRHRAHAALPGNSYGETAGELACALLFELRAHPAAWDGLCAAIAADRARHGAPAGGAAGADDAPLRKKANDMYAGLRDRADADACQAATGRPCTPNRMYTYRMLDMAYGEIARLFANWDHCAAQVADILGRPPADVAGAMPIEARQMRSIADCRAEWVIRWSATLERHTGAPGPLHTKSKRFASLKNQPQAIAAMLEEIGGYEALSANMDALGQVRGDEEQAASWLEDYWRVVAESEAAEAAGGVGDDGALVETPEPDLLDCLLAQPGGGLLHDAADDGGYGYDYGDAGDDDDDDGGGDGRGGSRGGGAGGGGVAGGGWPEQTCGEPDGRAGAGCDDVLSLSPGYATHAAQAEQAIRGADATQATQAAGLVAAVLDAVSLPVRLAVYHALLGPADDSYPDHWRDAATGELPPLRELAALDGISMPTLRKRRNEAMARLQQAAADGVYGKGRE